MITDIEDLMESVRSYVKTNLNTRIQAINSEKSDSYELETIPADDDHYIFGAELQDLPNHIFVNIAISEITPIQDRGNLALNSEFIIEVAFDNPKKSGTMLKSLRYMRALYEAIRNYEMQTNEVSSVEVTTLKPMIVTMTNRQLVVSGIGVSLGISN